MRFNLPDPKPEPDNVVRVGNVYASKNTAVTKYWVVIAVTGNSCQLVGINDEGEITTVQSYNNYVMEKRQLLGICNLSNLVFDIIPIEEV